MQFVGFQEKQQNYEIIPILLVGCQLEDLSSSWLNMMNLLRTCTSTQFPLQESALSIQCMQSQHAVHFEAPHNWKATNLKKMAGTSTILKFSTWMEYKCKWLWRSIRWYGTVCDCDNQSQLLYSSITPTPPHSFNTGVLVKPHRTMHGMDANSDNSWPQLKKTFVAVITY